MKAPGRKAQQLCEQHIIVSALLWFSFLEHRGQNCVSVFEGQLHSCVSIQGSHPSKAAFEDQMRDSSVPRLSHFEGYFKCSREMLPFFPYSKIHCAPVTITLFSKEGTMADTTVSGEVLNTMFKI